MLISLLIALCFGLGANEFTQKTLDNGMQVVIKRVPGESSINLSCFVITGSATEGRFLGSGISHYLEHVVSGGTTKMRAEEDYEELGKQIGALRNALTGRVFTRYFQTVNKEHYRTALRDLSEQMQFCSFDSMEVAREQQVIAKEIVHSYAPAARKLYQRFSEISNSDNNMQYPGIGYPDLFLKLSRQDLIDYYTARYVPNNMIFVVVGDIAPEEIISEVELAFEGFERKTLIPECIPTQAPVYGSREIIEEFEVQMPQIYIHQAMKDASPKELYALKASFMLLMNRENSPLIKLLKNEKQLINYLGSYTNTGRYDLNPSLTINLEVNGSEKVRETLDLLYCELAKYRKGYFKQEMLDKLISGMQANSILSDNPLHDQALLIGYSLINYGVLDVDMMTVENYSLLKPADLNAAVAKFLSPDNKLTFIGAPKDESSIIKAAKDKDVLASDLSLKDLGNGLDLIHRFNNAKPVVRGSIIVPALVFYESAETAGYIDFMANLLVKGSKKYPLEKLTNWLDERGAKLSSRANPAGIIIDFACLKKDLPEMQNIILDAIKNPLFSETEIQQRKQMLDAKAKRNIKNPTTVHEDFRNYSIFQSAKERLNNLESNSAIQKITATDLKALYKNYFKAPTAIITIVGDCEADQARDIARRIYASLDHKPIQGSLNIPELGIKNMVYSQEYPYEQAMIDINTIAPKSTDEDYYPMLAIYALLTFGNRRLHNATRGERDLSYTSHFTLASNPYSAYARVNSQTTREKLDELKSVLLGEMDRLINEPVSQEELSEAINDYIESIRNLMNDSSICDTSARFEFMGLGYNFVLKGKDKLSHVTPQDIMRVAKKYFSNRDVVISVPAQDVKRMINE